MAENKTFTLIGKFDDQITKKLKDLNRELTKLSKPLKDNNAAASLRDGFKAANSELKELSKNFEDLNSRVGLISKPIKGVTRSLNDAASAAGKVRDTVSQIGEGVKGLDGMTDSLEGAARAASRARSEVEGIGESAGRAGRRADDLMTTLLKADALSKFGDAMASGFDRGMRTMVRTAQKGAGSISKLFKDSMEDELADVKAASGIEGSFRLKGYEGSFKDSQKMYKKYDQVVSEMIRQSSAPTAKVVELQRYTLDTMGPLMLAAEGVAKGTKMRDIDPKKLEASAKNYGAFLEKAALFSQGTGSAGFRVAAGIEQLVTRGKIDTTIDFFSDNIMLMKNLEEAGFAGRNMRSAKMMTATDAVRMKAMMDAFNKSMSSESTKAMAQSLTGSLQGLQDTLFNPSVGILGMSVTFTKEEQKKANDAVIKIQNARINRYRWELKSVSAESQRAKELRANIEQAQLTRDQLTKDGADEISTPFKAFSYAFSSLVRSLTDALNSIGPVWTNFALAAIQVTNTVFGPLGETLSNVASNMRSKDPSKKMTQAEGFGRIVGEIFKTVGQIMGDLANMIKDPDSALGKAQSEFMKGFMSAFTGSGSLDAAKKGIESGISAFVGKLFEFIFKVITYEPIRPLVLTFIGALFGPPLISAVISSATPLIASAIFKAVSGSLIASTSGSVAGAGVGAAGGAAAAGVGGLLASVLGVTAVIASLVAAFVVFEGPLRALANWLTDTGIKLTESSNWAASAAGHFLKGLANILRGLTNFFTGIWDILVGMFTADQERIVQGVKKIFWGIGEVLKGVVQSIMGFGGIIVGAIGNLFNAIGRIIESKIPGNSQAAKAQGRTSSDWGTVGSPKRSATPVPPKSSLNLYGGVGPQITSSLGSSVEESSTKLQSYSQVVGMTVKESQNNLTVSRNLSQQQAIVTQKMTSAWEKTNITSQGNLLSTATDLSKSITSASFKINQASSSMKANPSSLAAPAVRGFIPGSSNNKMSLDEALSSEMRNKPSGSHLVIANSTETVIPAAQGFTPASGGPLSMLGAALSRYVGPLNKLGEMADGLKKLREGSPLFGGGFGSLFGAKSLAAMFGLSLTSFIRPYSVGSYHQIGRAMDFSNSNGPTPEMMAFAKEMIKRYGSSLTELIYTPLGFSVKNGRKVPPLAAAGHYNHVHVAYSLGRGNPAFFSSQSEAVAWERKMMPPSAKVASFTANTSEGFGNSTINAPITIYQQPNQDPEELASLVVMRIGMVVDELRNH